MARHRLVGGHEEGASSLSFRSDDQPDSDGDRSELSGYRGERSAGSMGDSHRSSPLFESMKRGELEALSAQLIARLRSSMEAREKALTSQGNEPYICGDRQDPGEAESRGGGRHGPVTSQTFGAALAQPGARRRLSDTGPTKVALEGSLRALSGGLLWAAVLPDF